MQETVFLVVKQEDLPCCGLDRGGQVY